VVKLKNALILNDCITRGSADPTGAARKCIGIPATQKYHFAPASNKIWNQLLMIVN